MSYIDEIVNEIDKKLTHGCEIAVFKAFLRQKIQETIEKAAKVAEKFDMTTDEQGIHSVVAAIRKIGD